MNYFRRPRLELVFDIIKEPDLIPDAGRIQIFIRNTGRAPASGARVDFFVHIPRWIYPGNGFLLEEEYGSYKSLVGLIDKLGPHQYRYQMRDEVLVNPSGDPIKIVSLPFWLGGSRSYDYRIMWEISHARMSKATGRIDLSRSELEQRLIEYHNIATG